MERTVYRKDVNTINNWTFDLGNSGELTPTYVIVGFQDRSIIDSQTHNTSVFEQLLISNAVCEIGSKKYPVDGMNCDYARDKYDQAYHEIENVFIHHTEH